MLLVILQSSCVNNVLAMCAHHYDHDYFLAQKGDYGNNAVRYLDLVTRMVTTLSGTGSSGHADGDHLSASFNGPSGVALTADASMALISDTNSQLIRRINVSTAITTTLAGSYAGYADGAGSLAQFNIPVGIAIDAPGVFALVVSEDFYFKVARCLRYFLLVDKNAV